MHYKITARYNHKDELITQGTAQMTLDCRAARDAIARLNESVSDSAPHTSRQNTKTTYPDRRE